MCGKSTASSRPTEIRSIASGEFTSIKSFADLEREEEEAQAKENEKK